MLRKIGRNEKNVRRFFNFHQNFLNSFLVKDLTNRPFFPLFVSFWEHTFLLGCNVWKMDDLFQRPLGPNNFNLNFSKKCWWKLTSHSFHQKNIWEVLIKIEGIQAIPASDGWIHYREFPVRISTQGKPCSHYREWVCSGDEFLGIHTLDFYL